MATILVSNPGSASRKYAVFDGEECKLQLHFEHEDGTIVCLADNGESEKFVAPIDDLSRAASLLPDLLSQNGISAPDAIALRIVAPSSYFLQHRRLDGEAVERLREQQPRAPLHISASLQELEVLQIIWPDLPVLGISDSAFHATKPDYAWNYGIKLEDADAHEIKRFGYHGLSSQSIVRQLGDHLPDKLVICHLGSGSSVIAVRSGVSVEATMGFSPLEGLIMSTRSGTIDLTAAQALKQALGLDDASLNDYLNAQGGLLGLSGTSSDIRELLAQEAEGHYRASLALKTYIHRVQQAVGQMVATLGGVDALVFTGTVGERAPAIRQRVIANLHFLELELDHSKNTTATNHLHALSSIHSRRSRPIVVVGTNEEKEMIDAAQLLLG